MTRRGHLALLLGGGGVMALAVFASRLEVVPARLQWRRRAMPLWVRTDHGIAYGPHPENRLDVMTRRWGDKPDARPAVLVFHGGGWREGSRMTNLVRVCARYLDQGFVVANADYRLGSIAAAVDDATAALAWFGRQASNYGFRPDKIVVTGESAGAHLALMAAFRAPRQPAAVVNIYGITDLEQMIGMPRFRPILPPGDSVSNARSYSPLTYVRSGLPPVLSIHGAADDLVPASQTARLTQALRAAGSEAQEYYVTGGKHGFSNAQQQLVYREIFAFLRSKRVLNS